MKYVDRILKYLSGELSRKEMALFDRDLERNHELQSEFNEVSMIHDKLEEMLRIKQQDPNNREKLIRELIAEHDTDTYGGPPVSEDEKLFTSRIRSSMVEKRNGNEGKSRSLFSSPLLLVAIAATLALVVILLLPDPSPEKLYAQYYKPMSDNTLLQFRESSRGETQAGISLYFSGNYRQTLEHFRNRINEEDQDPYISLFYALACIEEDCEYEVLSILDQGPDGGNTEIELAINWYTSLYLLKMGDIDRAVICLEKLIQDNNPYYQRAKRVLRKID